SVSIRRVRDILVLLIHLLVTLVRLSTPSGCRSVIAESVLIRHQLLILNRGRKRSPNLRMPSDGGPLQQVTRFPESGLFIEEPTISPDNRYLVYTAAMAVRRSGC